MRVQKESKFVWAIAVVAMCVAFLPVLDSTLADMGGNIFLYNRLYQMVDCFKHGMFPFIYYEDVGGIGYGSPIFYGQLTLLFFIPFIGSIQSFVKAYYLVSLLLNFFGFRCFIKRLSSYATLTSCFYIVSMPFLGLFNAILAPNCLAVGLSWFFLAFCIDFFRDSKNILLVILSYFAVWQTNFNTTVIVTLVCFCVFLVYFRFDRWKDYLRLFLGVFCVVVYDIVNMLVHRDSLHISSAETVLSKMGVHDIKVFSVHPLGGYWFRGAFSFIDYCNGFMSFLCFVVLVLYIKRYIGSESFRFKVCSAAIGVVAVIGYVIGVYGIWRVVYQATDIFFQFPIRYYIFIFGFVLAVLSRVIKPDRFVFVAVCLCIVDIVISSPFHFMPDDNGLWYWQLANYEYASDDFIKDEHILLDYSSTIHSTSGASYSFERDYNLVMVNCSSNVGGDILTLPKLYYKGYQAVGENGERFVVKSGFSNYCEVDIGDYTGILSLSYQVPVAVLILFYIQIVWFLRLLVLTLRRYFTHARAKGK